MIHPVVGRSIGIISIYAEPFFTDLRSAINKRSIFVDRVLLAAFVAPDFEAVLERVAKRHFGMGVYWDDKALTSLPGWDLAEGWRVPPEERHYAPPPPPPHGSEPFYWDTETAYEEWKRGQRRAEQKAKRASKPKGRSATVVKALEKLGLGATTTLAQATKAYRKGCLERHPDRGGSVERMVEWNAAWQVVKEWLAA